MSSAEKSVVPSEGFCHGRRRRTRTESSQMLALPVVEEYLIRGIAQPMLKTTAKIEYRTILYVGKRLRVEKSDLNIPEYY